MAKSLLPHFPSVLLLLLLLKHCANAQTNGTVTTGQFLTAGDDKQTPWLSPSSHFAFGFRQLGTTNLFLLSIWYYKIPDETIVWYANGDNPAPRHSRVELTTDRGLVLNDPRDREIWKSGLSLGSAASAFMNDTGNFAVKNANSENLWESFMDPRDTLLPTQILEKDGAIKSKYSETNFSFGRYEFRMLQDGNAVLNTINLPSGTKYDAYFWSDTYDTNLSNAGVRVEFNASGYLYVLRANDERKFLTEGKVVPASEYYHRATINFDGVFELYSHKKNSTDGESWSVIRTMPNNICSAIRGEEGTGPCGYNSICRLNKQRPVCECPSIFSPVDPNDGYRGCKPNFRQSCDEDEVVSVDDLVELDNVDWPTSDYEIYQNYNVEECKKSCASDCLCGIVVFDGQTCWKKKLPLSNGREDTSRTVFVKGKNGTLPSENPRSLVPGRKQNLDTLILVLSVLLGGSAFLNFISLGGICFGIFFYQNKVSRDRKGENYENTQLRGFTYKELVEATNGFKEELGRGSCGIVYKGVIEKGSKSSVAVKKLDRVIQDSEKEFKTEVKIIGQTHHKNLVQLLGYCNEGQHRLLVYEFLSNGTLASFLFGGSRPSWSQRTQIAIAISRGLLYLHEECSTQIIHCDIKPQNILLDDYYNARISDFGLSKLLMINQSHTNTGIRGTKGYVAPEWFRNMPITVKVDVYSFGVMLLEIIACRRCLDAEFVGEEKAILTDWAYDCYREGTMHDLVENDEEARRESKRLERFVMVAIWCIQEDPALRPSMRKVTQMLEGVVEVSNPPCPCPFSTVI